MPLTAADVDALFPPMSSANPTNSNINRALRIQAGLPPLTLLEARNVEEPKPESEDMPPAPTESSSGNGATQGMQTSQTQAQGA